jgi:hypothetical protein
MTNDELPMTTPRHLLALHVAAILLGGCASMNMQTSVPWAKEEKPQETSPKRMVAIWTDTVLHAAGKPSTRGFGGRLYFYDETNNAIPVEGTLVVYAYDDSRSNSLAREPDRKFVFRPEEFVEHSDSTQLGQSYSVWIPWDALGGYRAEVTLLPMFTTNKGNVIAGEQSKLSLPGLTPAPQGLAAGPPAGVHHDGAVQQASYMTPVEGTSPEQVKSKSLQEKIRRMRTASIPMTDTLKQRLIESETALPAPAYPFMHAESDRMGVLRTTGPMNVAPAAMQPMAPGFDPSNPQLAIRNPQFPEAAQQAYRTPSEAWQGETARIAAVLEEAQASQRAGWGSNLGPSLPGQPSSRSERMRSPAPIGAAATPVPGPAHWQPPHAQSPYVLPSTPPVFPPG